MKRPIVVLGVAIVAVAMGVAAYVRRPKPVPMPQPVTDGVSLELATDRAERIRRLEYDLRLDVPERKSDAVTGTVTARFSLAHADRPVVLDFDQPRDHVRRVRVNGRSIRPRLSRGHLVIPADRLRDDGRNEVVIDFHAGDESLNRQDELLYTLFVPARASLAIPVFDQPSLKARWTMHLTVPSTWQAVTNGAEIRRRSNAGRTAIDFARTEPLPTYLVAFVAGKFSVETAVRNGRTFRMFHRETDAAKLAANRDTLFDLHASSLAWLERYTGIPYPFGKYDFILIPSFQFSGMEHPGASYYDAGALLLDASASQQKRLTRASVIAHEVSHMWFGDLVTMRWFDDVWMKEVMANFMAAKIVNPAFPDVNHELQFLFAHYPPAYDVDRTVGANPIRQPLANLDDAASLYGAIIYRRAPIAMRQLERTIGEDAFRDGIREYLSAHRFGNASWPDLVRVLDARTPLDLASWSRAWIEERGRPRVEVSVSRSSGGRTDVVLRTHDSTPGRDLRWPQQLKIVFGAGAAADVVDVALDASGRVAYAHTSPAMPEGARWVLPTGGGLGYGDFVLDVSELQAMLDDLPVVADALTRGAMIVTLWESMLEGRLRPSQLRAAFVRAVGLERDELNVARLLTYLQTLHWRFSRPTTRQAELPALEQLMRAGLERASTTSLKGAWFGALRNIAGTPETVGWLRSVWSGDVTVAGLPFAEADQTDLSLDLAVRGAADPEAMLDAQHARIRNPDRRARFEFVRPAVSADPDVRRRFFERMREVAERRHEAWVVEAMGYIHHPLRGEASRSMLLPALGLTREIRETGDIFFPKKWADAVLSGYQDAPSADSVRAFMDGLPADYPQRLRWLLLASADPVFRAARLAE